jgi:hypothetical protein
VCASQNPSAFQKVFDLPAIRQVVGPRDDATIRKRTLVGEAAHQKPINPQQWVQMFNFLSR